MTLLLVVQFIAALGSGLMAGVFFAFSVIVMQALGRIPPEQGMAAMQSINVAVINPWFFTAFFGTPAACLIVAIAAFFRWSEPGAVYVIAGSVIFIVGTFLVTIIFNVPLNDALAAAKPESTEGAALWADYLIGWTNWNHVRTIAALVAAALLTIGICYEIRSLGAG